MRPVLTKKDFTKRYQAGEFGNASPTWHRIVDLPVEGNGLFHLRNRVVGGVTYYNLTLRELIRKWFDQPEVGQWYASQMAPTEKTVLQGEVQRQPRGLYLRYTRAKLPMREALEASQMHVWGLQAKLILQGTLDAQSYNWLGYLLDTYDDHVVEFSTYSVEWGTVPRYNTVFWEVRRY